MADVATSNVVVITAGLRRKPDESRLDLINRNVDLFMTLLEQVKTAGLKNDSYLVVVSNPVDVLTYLAVQRSGLPWQRVLGLGTQLDTARFRSHLAKRLQVPPTQVQAMILGEHGDSMVPIWSSATVAGLPMEQWPGFNSNLQREVFEETKTAGATLIKLKGGSGFGVGLSIREVVHALALDNRRVLPVSTLQQGLYGLRDVCLSVPTVVGCGGVREQIELELTPKERMGVAEFGPRTARDHRPGGGAHRQGARGNECRDPGEADGDCGWNNSAAPGKGRNNVSKLRQKIITRSSRVSRSWKNRWIASSRAFHADPHGCKDFILADAKDSNT